jgi:hypothetical protein
VWWRGRLRGGGADLLLESVVCHNFRRCGPPDGTRAQSRLLSRRMLGSLYRRFFLVSVQAARGRYRHVRMASRARCTSRAHGQVQGSNFFLRLLLALWPACERARSRPPHHTPAARVVQPPAARRSSHALRRKWIGAIAAISLRRYVAAPLGRYAAMSPRRYVATPLRRFVATPLCLFAAASLCREVRTRVCDGRALCMCVSVVACTGVGTCVARPRPQSTFANGWASGS